MPKILTLPIARLTDASGAVYPGGKLYSYLTGTTTAANVFTTAALTVAHSNPVVADSGGLLPPIFLDPAVTYRFVGETSAGVAISGMDFDPVSADAVRQMATRADLVALSSVFPTIILTESGREGTFQWSASNLSTRVSADPQQGIYIAPSSDPTGASGAWVRQLPLPGEWHADWFGIPNDPAAGNGGGTQVTADAEFNAMIALANLMEPDKIILGAKIYTLAAALTSFTFAVWLQGSRGAQDTVIVKRYVESDPVQGVLSFTDHGFTLMDLTIRASDGSGGSGISSILGTSNQANLGRGYIERINISMGDHANYSFYLDGSINQQSGGGGFRGLYVHGSEFFGAAVASVKMISIQHWLSSATFIVRNSGSSSVALDISGPLLLNDDLQFQGVISGEVTMDDVQRSVFVSPQIGNITVGASVNSTMWIGHRVTGVLSNGAASGEFVFAYDGMVVASGGNSTTGWEVTGSGKIRQWDAVITSAGAVTGQSWPIAFTTTRINVAANAPTAAGANIVTSVQLNNLTTTTFEARAFNFNYSTGAYAGASASVRYQATAQ